jgi:aryl-alcohol dehydrogenase-like predicted oxidoreductase
MQLIQLGKNGPKIAAIGVGCWAWGDRVFWEYGRGYTKADIREAFAVSLEAGVSFFDTAEGYGFGGDGFGSSERYLGEFNADLKQETVIATKFFPFPWRVTRGILLSAVRSSLKRLRVSSIQLYQMHWPLPPVSTDTWMNAMADAVEAGLVKQVGVSNYSPSEMERAYRVLERRGLHLASNQVAYNLLARKPERSGLVQLCKDLNVTLIAHSPLAQGLLTGKYNPQNPPRGLRGAVNTEILVRNKPLLDEMLKIGIQHDNKTMAQVALNWCIAKGALAIPGAKNVRQAKENAGALGWDLTEAEVAKLDELATKP